jgi:hypothetical protein
MLLPGSNPEPVTDPQASSKSALLTVSVAVNGV